MSKIGKKLISLPKGVDALFKDAVFSVKGPKGHLQRTVPASLSVEVGPDSVEVKAVGNVADKIVRTQWGLYRALISNMIIGVSEGFKKTLEFQGVGFKAAVKGNSLELSLGYSHPVIYTAPDGVTFNVEKSTITVSGIDRETVGQVAAEVRSKREPEPYKGSGIRYSDEIIKKKAGKKAIAAG